MANLTRRAALAGALPVLAAIPCVTAVAACAAIAAPDPVFATVEAHLAARKAFATAKCDDVELHRLAELEIEKDDAVRAVVPTTIVGTRALLQHVLHSEAEVGVEEPYESIIGNSIIALDRPSVGRLL